MKIALLTPTRQRPPLRERFHESVITLASNPENVFMYYYIDSDDPEVENYKSQVLTGKRFDCVGPPMSVSKSWNIIAQKAIEDGCDILIMGNDDLIYKTQDWDTKLINFVSKEFPDDIYCVWFKDNIHDVDSFGAFPIVSSRWFSILGYFTPGVFKFGYNDTWLFDIATRVGRAKGIHDVEIYHEHITTDSSLMDETYKRVWEAEEGNLYDKDREIWFQTESMREKEIRKLKDIVDKQYHSYTL